jgi:hypothetical protein
MSEASHVIRSAFIPYLVLGRIRQLAYAHDEQVGAAAGAKLMQWSVAPEMNEALVASRGDGQDHGSMQNSSICTVYLPFQANEPLYNLSLAWNMSKDRLISLAAEARLVEWFGTRGDEIMSQDCKAACVSEARRSMRQFEENRRREPTLWEGVFELLAGTGMSVLLKADIGPDLRFSGEALSWAGLLDVLGAEGATQCVLGEAKRKVFHRLHVVNQCHDTGILYHAKG